MNPAVHPPFACIRLDGALDWIGFWSLLQAAMKAGGYRSGSRRVYRAALRGLARHAEGSPGALTRRGLEDYLRSLGLRGRSASWIAMNISILRTAFDKACGLSLLDGRRGPRRPRTLPTVLSREQVASLFTVAQCPRDALLMGLLYGCGLGPGEAVRLRWGQIDVGRGVLALPRRDLPLPAGLLPLLTAGKEHAEGNDYLFPGRKAGRHLAERTAGRIVREAARRAGLSTKVSALVFRHSYAVHQLEAGVGVRELQEALGHETVETTLRYVDCLAPETESPADVLPAPEVPEIPAEAAHPPFAVEAPRRYFVGWLKHAWRVGKSRLKRPG